MLIKVQDEAWMLGALLHIAHGSYYVRLLYLYIQYFSVLYTDSRGATH